MIVIINIWL